MNNHDHNKDNHEGADREPVIASENLPSTDFRDAIPAWDEHEIHFRDYLDVIFRRKWLIISVLALTFISTVIFTLSATKIYKSSATVEVKQETPKVTKFEELVSAKLNVREFYETQVQLLRSSAMAHRIIDKMDLSNHPVVVETLYGAKDNAGIIQVVKQGIKNFIKSLLPKDKKREMAKSGLITEEVMNQNKLLGYFGDNMEVSLKRNSMLIDISFTTPSRELSKDIVNTAADEFVKWEIDKRLDKSRSARDFLMKQIDQAKIDLEKSEEELNRFAKHTGIVSLDTKLNSVYSQLEELNSAMGQAKVELIAKEAVYNQAVTDGHSYLPQVMKSQIIGNLKEEYARMQSEYENLAVTFRDDYPEVKAIKARMESIDRRIKDEEGKIYLAIKNEYMSSLKKSRSLRDSVGKQKELAIALNERATQYKIMDREVQTNKAIYQSLLERLKEIESMVGINSSNIYIVDRAELSIFPYKPKVFLNLMLAIVVGLFSGIGLAFFMEYFEDSITDPDQISERFQIPILGVVPFFKNDGYPIEESFINDPKSVMSESLRTARVSIQLSGDSSHAKSFLLTSTGPEEGKTTLAINLAMTFAGADEKVVLVDADMRKPRVHKALALENGGGSNSKGLSSFLAGVIDKGYMYDTKMKNLHVIPSGPIPPNPVELLASNRFTKLMDHLGDHFDRIILDAPPFHGFADILVLSQKIGGVILVSSIGETSRDSLRHFKKDLLNVHGTILGCIVNKVKLSKRYGYHSYYKYYRAYYSDYGADKKGKGKNLP
ncbi:MAG: polysaccharide biosynthesis tyrosine autokinase [Thermodesulfobacteriota bacterium]|nr:polysaccharide biosynthesis tyrosine autokinase [Thermodesulfobacteriota bacterium]